MIHESWKVVFEIEKLFERVSGMATQTILTIPVSHVTNNQMVNLALSNGQVVSTTLANLQSIAQTQGIMNTPTSNGEICTLSSVNWPWKRFMKF